MHMQKRITYWLALGLITVLFIIGCSTFAEQDLAIRPNPNLSTQSATPDCQIINHDLGETEICGQPQTVVVLSLHTLGLLLSLDMQPTGCATVLNIYQGDVFDDPARQIPYLGDRLTTQPVNLGLSADPSLEKLAALKPDLIIGEVGRNADTYDLLSQIAPTLLWENRTMKGQWQKSLSAIAAALGREEKAQEVMQHYDSLIANTRIDLANVVSDYPTLMLLGVSRLEEGARAITSDSFLGEVIEGVGFQLIPKSTATIGSNVPISIEALPTLNDADTIIVLGFNLDVNPQSPESQASPASESISDWLETHQLATTQQNWDENAIAQSLSASHENRVYFATFYKWNGINGPIGTELILEQLRQFLLTD